MHLDSRRAIVTDDRHTQAAPQVEQTNARLAAALAELAGDSVMVMGGFIASTEDGVTTTLGRDRGSDYTAAIVGAGIGAEEIQIWTDVDGMLTCDPTILAEGYRVKTCSFAGGGLSSRIRRQGLASGDSAAGHREKHSRADFELGGGRNRRVP